MQVLLEFPCELVSALVAGRLSAKGRAFNPFLRGYLLRLLVAGVLTGLVSHAPPWRWPTLPSLADAAEPVAAC